MFFQLRFLVNRDLPSLADYKFIIPPAVSVIIDRLEDMRLHFVERHRAHINQSQVYCIAPVDSQKVQQWIAGPAKPPGFGNFESLPTCIY